MNVVLDVNIIIDYLVKREPFFNTTRAAIEKLEKNRDRCFLSCFSISTIFYLIKKSIHSEEDALNIMKRILYCYEFIQGDYTDIINSLESDINDYEDALIESSAIKINADYILTRDIKDFANSKIKAIDPYHFLKSQ